jgi:3-phenylpropionate/cinnamic acid dioxygenase small subunit
MTDIQEDRWQIQQLLYRYCELVDELAWERMGEVFTDDTVGVYNGMEVPGLETLVASGQHNMTRRTLAATQHNVANLRIDVQGDEATCISNYYAVHLGAGDFAGGLYSMWGEYRDALRREPRGWRISRRDYRSFFTEGDERMVFAGGQPTWQTES